MITPGTAPTHGPMSGTRLNAPAIMPTMSQNGRSMIAKPTLTMIPTITATASWPRKKPPMATFNRWATWSTWSLAERGMRRRDTAPMWGRSTSR